VRRGPAVNAELRVPSRAAATARERGTSRGAPRPGAAPVGV